MDLLHGSLDAETCTIAKVFHCVGCSLVRILDPLEMELRIPLLTPSCKVPPSDTFVAGRLIDRIASRLHLGKGQEIHNTWSGFIRSFM